MYTYKDIESLRNGYLELREKIMKDFEYNVFSKKINLKVFMSTDSDEPKFNIRETKVVKDEDKQSEKIFDIMDDFKQIPIFYSKIDLVSPFKDSIKLFSKNDVKKSKIYYYTSLLDCYNDNHSKVFYEKTIHKNKRIEFHLYSPPQLNDYDVINIFYNLITPLKFDNNSFFFSDDVEILKYNYLDNTLLLKYSDWDEYENVYKFHDLKVSEKLIEENPIIEKFIILSFLYNQTSFFN